MTRPLDYVTGEERNRALRALKLYSRSYTGRHFETFSSMSSHDEFTPVDILAVEMLSVRVPANTTAWLLLDGAATIRPLLAAVPKAMPIWSDELNLEPDGHLWCLWKAIKDGPAPLGGSVVRSKLLAAKRPHAVPIYDKHVGTALGISGRAGFWAYWRDELRGSEGEELRAVTEALAGEADASPHLSVLRALDIIIWMRQHGWRATEATRAELEDFSEPVQ